MKSLLILTFVAVAAANSIPAPIRLSEPVEPQTVDDVFSIVSFMPLIIPQEVAEAFKRDLEINPPINEEILPSPVNFVDSLDEIIAVKFVDAPEYAPVEAVRVADVPEIEATAEDIVPVKFVDTPFEEVADLEEEIAPSPVKVVDALNEDSAVSYDATIGEVIEAVPVNFVDAPLEEVAAPTPVKFIDAPLSENADEALEVVRVVRAGEIASASAEVVPVKFVNSPLEEEVAGEEIVPSPVKVVDAPLEEVLEAVRVVNADEVAAASEDVVPVKFVDAPLEEVSDVGEKIAPSPVKFVDAANDRPFKFYDPLLR